MGLFDKVGDALKKAGETGIKKIARERGSRIAGPHEAPAPGSVAKGGGPLAKAGGHFLPAREAISVLTFPCHDPPPRKNGHGEFPGEGSNFLP